MGEKNSSTPCKSQKFFLPLYQVKIIKPKVNFMKKLLLISVLMILSVLSNAQIFTDKIVYDKFDDVISHRDVKTIIAQSDTTITFEEKGGTPTEYKIVCQEYAEGNEDNIVNLYDNIYGYETCWLVSLNGKFFYINHRIVTNSVGTYIKSEMFWIATESGERTIYYKQLSF